MDNFENQNTINVEFILEFFMNDAETAILNGITEVMSNNDAPPLKYFDGKERKRLLRTRDQLIVKIPKYLRDFFKEHFIMSRATINNLVIIISQRMPGRTNYFAELPKKVIFTLWFLATQESFHSAGKRFGFAKSTAYKIFKEISGIIAGMLPLYVKFPDRTACNKQAVIFQRRSHGFPGVVGAIDEIHIPIKTPFEEANEYLNKSKKHSIILQGTCDHKARFIDVFFGVPGRAYDPRVFRQSDLFAKLNCPASPLLPPHLHLVGDSAYPLMQSLMTPFRYNGEETEQQYRFNAKLSSCRSIIERAFGLLKSKFIRLKYLDVSSPEQGHQIIAASCTLHNFLIDNNEVDSRYILEEHKPTIDKFEDFAYEDVAAIEKRNDISNILL